MKELKGTKTEKNLWEAFAGESQAAAKYGYFASVAKKEGYEQISAIFSETQKNEVEHAKLWFKYLNGIGKTPENLISAAEGENYELSLIHILGITTLPSSSTFLTIPVDFKKKPPFLHLSTKYIP